MPVEILASYALNQRLMVVGDGSKGVFSNVTLAIPVAINWYVVSLAGYRTSNTLYADSACAKLPWRNDCFPTPATTREVNVLWKLKALLAPIHDSSVEYHLSK